MFIFKPPRQRGLKKGKTMSALPSRHYTLSAAESREFALSWFKKMYPDLLKIEEDTFEDVAFSVFDVCKNLIGTESTSASGVGFGGSHGEIRAAIGAAMGIAIEFDADAIRHFNNGTIAALARHWRDNDHAGFLTRCAGYERNATNSKIDLLPVAQEVAESTWEMVDEEETEDVVIDPIVAEYAAVLGESTVAKRFITGNRHARRLSKKPPTRQQKFLDFDDGEV
jgi:hypothetical protein